MTSKALQRWKTPESFLQAIRGYTTKANWPTDWWLQEKWILRLQRVWEWLPNDVTRVLVLSNLMEAFRTLAPLPNGIDLVAAHVESPSFVKTLIPLQSQLAAQGKPIQLLFDRNRASLLELPDEKTTLPIATASTTLTAPHVPAIPPVIPTSTVLAPCDTKMTSAPAPPPPPLAADDGDDGKAVTNEKKRQLQKQQQRVEAVFSRTLTAQELSLFTILCRKCQTASSANEDLEQKRRGDEGQTATRRCQVCGDELRANT